MVVRVLVIMVLMKIIMRRRRTTTTATNDNNDDGGSKTRQVFDRLRDNIRDTGLLRVTDRAHNQW